MVFEISKWKKSGFHYDYIVDQKFYFKNILKSTFLIFFN